MCEYCVVVLDKVFPRLPKEQAGDFLMSHTAFPFKHGYGLYKQLRTARKAMTQGKRICWMCSKARANKRMKGDFCKTPCAGIWEKST